MFYFQKLDSSIFIQDLVPSKTVEDFIAGLRQSNIQLAQLYIRVRESRWHFEMIHEKFLDDATKEIAKRIDAVVGDRSKHFEVNFLKNLAYSLT